MHRLRLPRAASMPICNITGSRLSMKGARSPVSPSRNLTTCRSFNGLLHRQNMAKPMSGQYRWLKRISPYLWVNWILFKSAALLLRQPRERDPADYEAAERQFIATLLGAGLDHETPPGRLGWWQSVRYYLRSLSYDRAIQTVLTLLVTNRVVPNQAQLSDIIHLAELSLSYYETASDRAIARAWTKSYKVHLRRRKIGSRVSRHLTLAVLHERFGVGDSSQSLERASEHYELAAKLLESEG